MPKSSFKPPILTFFRFFVEALPPVEWPYSPTAPVEINCCQDGVYLIKRPVSPPPCMNIFDYFEG